MPAPMLAPHQLAAAACCAAPVVALDTSPRPVATTPATPTPSTRRPMTNVGEPSATAHSTDPVANTQAPVVNTRRRPTPSPSAPAHSRLTASPTLIELRIHVAPAGEARRDSVSAGAFPNGPE